MSRKLISFDWAMKRILREKANFGILEGFLSELLKIDIKIEEILESESNQEDDRDKFNRVDMLAKNDKGELILIELQHDSEQDYFHRMLYGASKLICEYMQKGNDYSKVKKVYSINIVYFDLGQGFDYLYYGKMDFRGLNHSDDLLQLNKRQKDKFKKESVYEIFPEYYVIKVNKFNDIAKNSIDEWIYFLKNEEIKSDFKAKGLDKAKTSLDVLKLDEIERKKYNRREENKMLENSLLNTARDEGFVKGIETGIEKGIEKGEKQKAIAIAKNLLDVLDIDTVSIKTGLTKDEIETLINKG